MPTFLFGLRLGEGSLPFVASLAIVDPITSGYRGRIRRFPDLAAVESALREAGVTQDRYQSTVQQVCGSEIKSFEVTVSEAQKLDILQLDSTE